MQEIDYILEGQNADRFRTNFRTSPWIKVPAIIWPLSSERVLTMEYVPGTKINRAEEIDKLGIDRGLLAQRAVESYLQQLLTHGFFHAGGQSWHACWYHCASCELDFKYTKRTWACMCVFLASSLVMQIFLNMHSLAAALQAPLR